MNANFAATLQTLSGMSAEFGYLVDHGRATDCAKLFAADSKLIFGAGSPKPGTLHGIEAIRAFLIVRQAQTHVTTRHVTTYFRLQWDGGAEARLESVLTVFRSDDATRLPAISVVADVHEIFVRGEGDSWLIQERLTMPVFVLATVL